MDASHDRSQRGHVETVSALTRSWASVHRTNYDNQSALSIAAKEDHVEICRLLLDRKIKVDQLEKGSWTPLLHAVRNGSSQLVSMLLERVLRSTS